MRFQPWLRWLEQSPAWKMAKHLEEMEFLQKYGSTEANNLFSRLHQLITNAWEVGSVPQAWKDTSIVTIYKKGDWTDYGNYRGISLLSIAGKIFARVLLNRLSTHITPETQRGFRGNRSTVDMIFCLWQLQEKCIEQDRPLYMVFVDFSKAFDTLMNCDWQ